MNLPYSKNLIIQPINDYTFSKSALTNYFFDVMGNKIVDFKFVDLRVSGEYKGTHLFYPEPDLSVFGYEDYKPLKDPGVVITEIMHKNDIDTDDYFVIHDRSNDNFEVYNVNKKNDILKMPTLPQFKQFRLSTYGGPSAAGTRVGYKIKL